MLRSIGKQSGKSVESVLEKKRKATVQKRKALSLGWKMVCVVCVSEVIDIGLLIIIAYV